MNYKLKTQNEKKKRKNENASPNKIEHNSPKIQYKFDNSNFLTTDNINKSKDINDYIYNNNSIEDLCKQNFLNKEIDFLYQNDTDNNNSFNLNKISNTNKNNNNFFSDNLIITNNTECSNIYSIINYGFSNIKKDSKKKKMNDLFIELNNFTANYNNQKNYISRKINKNEYSKFGKSVENKKIKLKQNSYVDEKDYIRNYINKNFDEKFVNKQNSSNKKVISQDQNKLNKTPNNKYLINNNKSNSKVHYNSPVEVEKLNKNKCRSNKNLKMNNIDLLENQSDKELIYDGNKNLYNRSGKEKNRVNNNNIIKDQNLNFINEYFSNKKISKIKSKERKKIDLIENIKTIKPIMQDKEYLEIDNKQLYKIVEKKNNKINNENNLKLKNIRRTSYDIKCNETETKSVKLIEINLPDSHIARDIINQKKFIEPNNKDNNHNLDIKKNNSIFIEKEDINSEKNIYDRSYGFISNIKKKYIDYEEPSIENLNNYVVEDYADTDKNQAEKRIDNYEKLISYNNIPKSVNINNNFNYTNLHFPTNLTEISNNNNNAINIQNNFTSQNVTLNSFKKLENLISKNIIANKNQQNYVQNSQEKTKTKKYSDLQSCNKGEFNISNDNNFYKKNSSMIKFVDINCENLIDEDYLLSEYNKTKFNKKGNENLNNYNNKSNLINRSNNESRNSREINLENLLVNKNSFEIDKINNITNNHVFRNLFLAEGNFRSRSNIFELKENKEISSQVLISPNSNLKSPRIDDNFDKNFNLNSFNNNINSENSKILINEEDEVLVLDENVNFNNNISESQDIYKNKIKENLVKNNKFFSKSNLKKRLNNDSNDDIKLHQNENESKFKDNEKIEFFPYPNLEKNKNLNRLDNLNNLISFDKKDIGDEKKIIKIYKSQKNSNIESTIKQKKDGYLLEGINNVNTFSTESNSRSKNNFKLNENKEIIYGIQNHFFNNEYEKISFLENKILNILDENKVNKICFFNYHFFFRKSNNSISNLWK